ncbi:competence protein CoiA family protein [Cupriavidus sp. CP313]
MELVAKLPFALDASGEIVSVRDFASGLACQCICPGCGARMVAKQGDAQVWHFAHHRAENCTAGYESALHMAVKWILAEVRRLFLAHCGVVRHPIPVNGLRIQDRNRNVTWFDVFEYATTNAEDLAQS